MATGTGTSTVTAAPPPVAANPPPAKVEKKRDPKTAEVAVVALSDFHGWLLPLEPKGYPRYYGGIANLGR